MVSKIIFQVLKNLNFDRGIIKYNKFTIDIYVCHISLRDIWRKVFDLKQNLEEYQSSCSSDLFPFNKTVRQRRDKHDLNEGTFWIYKFEAYGVEFGALRCRIPSKNWKICHSSPSFKIGKDCPIGLTQIKVWMPGTSDFISYVKEVTKYVMSKILVLINLIEKSNKATVLVDSHYSK